MGGYPIDDEVGALVQPQQGGGWTDLLNDPIKRSALLSFGLQAMTGGWGNGTQQMAAALGAGAQGASGTAEALQKQGEVERGHEFKQQQLAQTASEGEKNRQKSLEIARVGADSRQEVAQIRTEAMLQRAAMIHGPQNDKEMKIFADARTAYMKKEKDNQLLSRKSDAQIVQEADAWAKEQLRGARDAVGVRSQGSALPSSVNSQNSPGAGDQKPGGSQAPGAETPSTATEGITLDKLLADPAAGPKAAEDLKTPEGQQRLLKKFPMLGNDIYRYNAKKSTPGYAEKFGYGR